MLVHFWLDGFGESSGVYGFRFIAPDGQTVHAEGRRIIIKLDPRTMRPSPWTSHARDVAETLRRDTEQYS